MVFNVSVNYTKIFIKNQLPMRKLTSKSPQNTGRIALEMAKDEPKGGFYCLHGNLGAGKTVFVKGFAKGLGIDPKKIKSPTYTYLRSYRVNNDWLHHFDFYRINGADDLMKQDLAEIFNQHRAWILVEWPENIAEILPKDRTDIFFKYLSDLERRLTIKK